MGRNASNKAIDRIEDLLKKPCWVVDMLPRQVPRCDAERFFAVEQWYLEGPYAADLHQRFVDVLLKLNCYCDFEVVRGDGPDSKRNPSPKKLAKWLYHNDEMLNILVEAPVDAETPAEAGAPVATDAPADPETPDGLISVPGDSTYMVVYNPTPELLDLIKALAAAEGLFVWQAPQVVDE